MLISLHLTVSSDHTSSHTRETRVPRTTFWAATASASERRSRSWRLFTVHLSAAEYQQRRAIMTKLMRGRDVVEGLRLQQSYLQISIDGSPETDWKSARICLHSVWWLIILRGHIFLTNVLSFSQTIKKGNLEKKNNGIWMYPTGIPISLHLLGNRGEIVRKLL